MCTYCLIAMNLRPSQDRYAAVSDQQYDYCVDISEITHYTIWLLDIVHVTETLLGEYLHLILSLDISKKVMWVKERKWFGSTEYFQ